MLGKEGYEKNTVTARTALVKSYDVNTTVHEMRFCYFTTQSQSAIWSQVRIFPITQLKVCVLYRYLHHYAEKSKKRFPQQFLHLLIIIMLYKHVLVTSELLLTFINSELFDATL